MTLMPLVVRSLLLIALAAWAATVWWLSSDPFFVVGGSDAAALILEPPREAQSATAIVLGIAIVLALIPWPGRVARRGAWAALALVTAAFALSTHRVVIDPARGQIRDVWAMVTLQSIGTDPADGLGTDPRWQLDRQTLTFQRPDGQTMTVLLGIAPLRIETAELAGFAG